jgi:hypothetical protein
LGLTGGESGETRAQSVLSARQRTNECPRRRPARRATPNQDRGFRGALGARKGPAPWPSAGRQLHRYLPRGKSISKNWQCRLVHCLGTKIHMTEDVPVCAALSQRARGLRPSGRPSHGVSPPWPGKHFDKQSPIRTAGGLATWQVTLFGSLRPHPASTWQS